ncbi:hypothetical protein IJ384_07510 [bacterium]|nr:hypothetical protein [bacterium]
MNKFNVDSAKFLSILIIICIIFILVIAHAYNYLPKNEDMSRIEDLNFNNNYVETEHKNSVKKNDVNADEYNKNQTNKEIKSKNKAAFETIDEEKLIANNGLVSEDETNIESLIKKARNLKNENALDAVSQYQNIIKLTDDNNIKATCYEEIALILAQNKRYGSALGAIQRGYNLAPNTTREFLLARLYYKTGNEDKAMERINNILKRDFFVE